ncbi:hypothetical protein QQS21_003054 [Conoideocrella luteorostrata]|uniref:Copper acquisition factor BIM1-like domain-containing protein n=1 Tax=Conoideocrella luteorostrata TaxID=1105319 RepID=A0AAJ0CTW6_9HYPO|nr:hypothetical protein QQS21_003054 [Conoideocrella luteorostrata]
MFVNMPPLTSLSAVAAVLAVAVIAANPTTSNEMGPAAFMWPPDRVWSAAADNTAPCGWVDTVRNRTSFPLTDGNVALVDQKEAFRIELSISYKENPESNNDFKTLIKPEVLAELDMGHTCVPVGDAPSSVKAGANATLQIKYTASFDKPENETFYACADITYIEFSNFKEKVPCFNATQPGSGSKTQTGAAPTATSTSDSSKQGGSGSSGLSGGAIAGIVVGVVAGVGLLAAAALLIYRRKQQRLRILRQQNSARHVKWDQQQRDSHSNSSVRMQNLS